MLSIPTINSSDYSSEEALITIRSRGLIDREVAKGERVLGFDPSNIHKFFS